MQSAVIPGLIISNQIQQMQQFQNSVNPLLQQSNPQAPVSSSSSSPSSSSVIPVPTHSSSSP
jgi:hypothetical protein